MAEREAGFGSRPHLAKMTQIDQDSSDWEQVTAPLSVNTLGTLLFPLPKTLSAGKYRFVLRTRCTSSLKYERREMVTTVSDAIAIQ